MVLPATTCPVCSDCVCSAANINYTQQFNLQPDELVFCAHSNGNIMKIVTFNDSIAALVVLIALPASLSIGSSKLTGYGH